MDDFGRYDAEPRLLRSHAFPFGDPVGKDIALPKLKMMCEQLSISGLVDFYETPDEKKYLQVSRWQERTRAEKSKYPAFDNTCQQMFGSDNKCSLPSSPSSSPSSSPPSPSSPPDALRFPANAGDEFKDLFNRWIPYRKGMGKKPKDWNVLFQEQLDWIAKQPRSDWNEIVSQSIRNCWQGLFDLKKQRTGAHPDLPKRLDPSKIELPERFKSWTAENYPERRESAMKWKTWAEVPNWLREEWWKEEKAKLPLSV